MSSFGNSGSGWNWNASLGPLQPHNAMPADERTEKVTEVLESFAFQHNFSRVFKKSLCVFAEWEKECGFEGLFC